MKDKVKDYILIFLFLIIIIIGAFINVVEENKTMSISERRMLKQLPDVKKFFSGNYSNDFEEYVMDQIIYRDDLRKVKEYVHFNVLNQKDNNGLFINGEGIYKNTGMLNEKEVLKAADKIKKVADKYLDDTNNIFYSIIPDKNYYLDDSNLKMDYKKLEEILTDNLEISRYKYISLFSLLNKDDYYKTDSHWKQENLIDVAKKLGLEMNSNVLLEEYDVLEKGTFQGVYAGQLASNIGNTDILKYVVNDTIKNASTYNYENNKESFVYDESKWKSSNDKYDYFVSGATPIIEIKNNLVEEGKELIIFRDSFGSSIAPLLLEGYSKIILVDLRYVPTDYVGDYVEFNGKDILFIYSTLILNESSILR